MVRSDSDPRWFLKYERIYIGKPSKREDMNSIDTSPQMCRLRDFTYSAPIFVDLQYWKGSHALRKPRVEIGQMPVMLRSDLCVLCRKSEAEMVEYSECPYDPGGYFIVNGVERILLMQEQGLANRIIVSPILRSHCAPARR
jgi:DNA-directed RNA polymerase III subunit RPC2